MNPPRPQHVPEVRRVRYCVPRQPWRRTGRGRRNEDDEGDPAFVHSLEPDPRALSDLRREVSEWPREAGADEEAVRAVAGATHEAAAGAIARSGFVRVRGNIDRHAVTMVVEGEGEWDSLDEDVDGHRMELVRRLVSDTAIEYSEGTTSVRLQRRF